MVTCSLHGATHGHNRKITVAPWLRPKGEDGLESRVREDRLDKAWKCAYFKMQPTTVAARMQMRDKSHSKINSADSGEEGDISDDPQIPDMGDQVDKGLKNTNSE